MQTLITRVVALSALILGVVAAPMTGDHVPRNEDKPDKVTITGYSYAGSGCPAGSVAEMLEPDFSSVTFLFDNYIATAGPGISFAESRKNCNLIIGFEYTPGWTYALFSTEYRGFVKLDKGVTALQKSTYRFDGEPESTPWMSTWGPDYEVEEDYVFTDHLDREPEIWSPCDSSANNMYINTQIRVSNWGNPSGRGVITTDSITQRVTHVYGIRWRMC